MRLVAGGAALKAPTIAPGEKKWLALYAPLSFAYRIMVSTLIVLWIAGYSTFLAAVAVALLVSTMLLQPLWGVIEQLRATVPSRATRWRAAITATGVLMGLATVAYAVPLPHHTTAPGIVWLPEHAHVRAGTDGFVRSLIARDGDTVQAGDMLIVLEDPELIAEKARLESRLDGLHSQQFSVWMTDAAEAQRTEQEIRSVTNELERTEERIARLTIHAHSSGKFVMPFASDLPGKFVVQGTTLGYVFDHGAIRVRAAVPEYDAILVRASRQTAQVRISDAPVESMTAELIREIPAATLELPSAALGDKGGGPFLTDPADDTGLHVLEPVVLVDVTLPQSNLQRVGSRAWVRFDHGAQPLAKRWWRRLRQVFLDKTDPGGA